ncbi:nitrate reductase molybdenum cofactor assembly chaperone [Streptomyces sp. TP-A0874]|uniref:nitrate reductase molybdenum cofactor assembly chaperone n=1 Tax=Streptomyces sp. TP-A0874 TaxID=549819 RepID=UPI000852A076|nr:nitrate reductase molybdenum cofactor assembly chaperone [Streptomyces sp. TP-A0874]
MSRLLGRIPADAPLLHRICSVLLRYPDERTPALLGDVTAALPAVRRGADRQRLATATERLSDLSPGAAAQAYVATFDHTRRRSLHLTYYRHGDTRARGMALLALKHAYRQAGHPPPERELPDYLPLMLEFASVAPAPGRRVLMQCRSGLELLRRALHETGKETAVPYAAVLDTVCAGLPELGPRQREKLRRLAAEGPPEEQVGLEPFAPPFSSALTEPFAPPDFLSSPAHLTGESR